MQKQNVVITKINYPNDVCNITLNNIGQHSDLMHKVPVIINRFSSGSDLFVGSYKKDGFLLSNEQIEQFCFDIPEFFKACGEILEVDQVGTLSNPNRLVGDMYVFHAPVSWEMYTVLNKVFLYFLETVVFSPKIDWTTFIELYKKYTQNGTHDFIQKGYTDFLFSFVDSGDFTISFQERTISSQLVIEEIQDIIF